MNTQAIPRPTESELEILSILWKYGKSSVRTVHDEISKSKPTKCVPIPGKRMKYCLAFYSIINTAIVAPGIFGSL